MKYVIANLKMNLLSPRERDQYLVSLAKELKKKKINNFEIILCPPFVHLEAFAKNRKKNIKIGAQDVFSENKGSYTGEISPSMLKNFGCEYVILGHSERRRYFSENNEDINLKILAALKENLIPILCLGETKAEKENETTLQVIENQIKECLTDVPRSKIEKIIFVYEPVWAVGSDLNPTVHEIMEAKVLIKKILVEMFGQNNIKNVRILYGGSVNSKNAKEVCLDPDLDGVLVGRESLLPHEFIKIVETISNS